MKRIGLIGGMSWESSALYYSLINGLVKERLGGTHSARCILTSVDFADIEVLQFSGDWEEAGRLLALEAQGLEAAGADFLVLCTNTMHRVVREIREAVGIPLLHIGDVVSREVLNAGLGTVALLGTAFTMEQPFYRNFISAYGIDVLVPPEAERAAVHRVIYEELVLGVVSDESRQDLTGIIADLVGRGAQGVILGCTELELLIGQGDSPVPVFPTTRLHAVAAVDEALR
ncbi:aspartate/glutamate racemase family protein [Arthrobacter sp. Br18]|uniref:aspartate/glutamate racemase family protein n=1 Tax=Arthrobacter sp. Br18 TaxID=1312954 RepID=UPI00047A5DCB|nr:aspartate/glutamate racemase family protein [Arthrobacter sp. Br18]